IEFRAGQVVFASVVSPPRLCGRQRRRPDNSARSRLESSAPLNRSEWTQLVISGNEPRLPVAHLRTWSARTSARLGGTRGTCESGRLATQGKRTAGLAGALVLAAKQAQQVVFVDIEGASHPDALVVAFGELTVAHDEYVHAREYRRRKVDCVPRLHAQISRQLASLAGDHRVQVHVFRLA